MVDENKNETVKKTAAKKSPAKKTSPAKTSAGKGAAKKTSPAAKKSVAKPAAKKSTPAKKTTPAKKATSAKAPASKKVEPVKHAQAGLGSPEPTEVKQALATAKETAKAFPLPAKTAAETVKTVGADLSHQLEAFVDSVKKDFVTNRRSRGAKGALMLTPQFVVSKAVEAATVTVEHARKTAEDQRRKLMKR